MVAAIVLIALALVLALAVVPLLPLATALMLALAAIVTAPTIVLAATVVAATPTAVVATASSAIGAFHARGYREADKGEADKQAKLQFRLQCLMGRWAAIVPIACG